MLRLCSPTLATKEVIRMGHGTKCLVLYKGKAWLSG
jgi:hypothetical protein